MISKQAKRDLLEALSAVEDIELRHATVDVFEVARRRAVAGEVDVVVLAARRLACVYQLLVGKGLPPLTDSCAVISDRFLDLPGEWPWSRVLILDDSVVLGTTLMRLRDDIRDRIGPNGLITSLAVCLDSDQYASILLEDLQFEKLTERPSAEVELFSQQLVDALFCGGIPFFSDYPATKSIELSAKEWEDHLANDGWHVADVTAPLLAKSSRQAFAHIPTDSTLDYVLSRLPRQAAQLVEGMKVRSYFNRCDDDGGVVVRFVPIAMLAPCTPEELDGALQEIATISEISELIASSGDAASSSGIDRVAKHRLVQAYISTCVLNDHLAFTRQNSQHADDKWQLDDLQIGLYFGNKSALMQKLIDAAVEDFDSKANYDKARPPHAIVSRPQPSWLLEEESVQRVLWANRELLAETGAPPEPPSGHRAQVGLIFGHAVASIFGFINREFELAQRREIKSIKSLVDYRKQYPTNNQRRVLTQGLTLHELTTALLPDSLAGSSWERSLISLAIDIGNDLGAIVPVTQYDDVRDLVYRCYRLGETAPLAATPLPEAAETGNWDSYSLTAAAGFPIFNREIELTSDPESTDTDNMSALRDEVRRAVPGNVLVLREGEVLDVDDEYFFATFSDPVTEKIHQARIGIDELVPQDRRELAVGALLTWTIFQRRSDNNRDRTSRLRLRHEPPMDNEDLKRDAEALSALADAN